MSKGEFTWNIAGFIVMVLLVVIGLLSKSGPTIGIGMFIYMACSVIGMVTSKCSVCGKSY